MRHAIFPLALLGFMTLIGCESTPRADDEPRVTASAVEPVSRVSGGGGSELNDGYHLLHELVSKQKRVSTALIIPFKKVSDPSRTLIKEIAQVSTEATQQLEAFAKSDPSLQLDAGMLSPIEKATRQDIESVASRRILGAGGNDFELQLLVAQVDATDYGAALARQLAEVDNNAERSQWLRDFAAKYEQFRQRAIERLSVK